MSHNPLTIIDAIGIPTDSYIRAATTAGQLRDTTSATKYNKLIARIVGFPTPVLSELNTAQMTFGYLIQTIVKQNIDQVTDKDHADNLFVTAKQQAEQFIQTEPWHWSVDESEVSPDTKGSIKERVMSIVESMRDKDKSFTIDALVDQFDIALTTAKMYYRTAAKDLGITQKPVAGGTASGPKIGKQERATAHVQANPNATKAEYIAALTELLDTTPAGAQTYYYGAIKALNIKPQAAPRKKGGTKQLLEKMFNEHPNLTKIEFLEMAEVKHDVQVTTAQTYYYAILADRRAAVASK